MSFLNRFAARLSGKKIGEDKFGNKYYISFFKNYLGKRKRFVIYNGVELPSKVPPLWHAWLHYLSDQIPTDQEQNFGWQKDYQPNLTGTKYSYDPARLSDRSPVYNNWKPNK